MSTIPHFPVSPAITVIAPPTYKMIRRSRSALPTTETELKLIMAAAAMIGLQEQGKERIERTGRDRHTNRVADEREEEVLFDASQ